MDDQSSVSSGRILQYEPYQDPIYIEKSLTLARPFLPAANHQSLVRNEHYFATLATQEQGFSRRTDEQGFLKRSELTQSFNKKHHTMKNSPVKTCEDWIYWKDPKTDHQMYSSVLENPISEI